MSILDSFIIELYKMGGINIGMHTTRNAGEHPIYINLRICMAYPKLLEQLVLLYIDMIDKIVGNELSNYIFSSVPYGTLHLTSVLAYKARCPVVIPRDGYLYGERFRGPCYNHILIEDIVTTGGSVNNVLDNMKGKGYYDNKVFAFLSYYDIEDINTITNITHVIYTLEKQNLITSNKALDILNFFRSKNSKNSKNS